LRENSAMAYDIEAKIRAAHGLDFDRPKDEPKAKDKAASNDDDDNVVDI